MVAKNLERASKISLGPKRWRERAKKKKRRRSSTGKYEIVDIDRVPINILAKNLINSIF
jgi:hypothetical protein